MNKLKNYVSINKFKYFFTAILFFIIICCKNNTFASYDIEKYDINANIQTDGSMKVIEDITYKFSEDYNGVFRDILYKYNFDTQKNDMYQNSSRYQADSVKDIKVFASNSGFNNLVEYELNNDNLLSNGMDKKYSITEVSDKQQKKLNMKVYSPASDGSKKFVRYEYVITNVVAMYNDASEIYWNFIGKDWKCDINNLTVNITWNATSNLQEVRYFAHTYANIADIRYDNNKLSFNVKYLSSGVPVDARLVLPQGIVTSSSKVINENYDYNLLDKIENKMAADKTRKVISDKILIGIIFFGIVSFIYMVIKINVYIRKQRKSPRKLDYFRDIPSQFSLAEYKLIQNKSIGVTDSNLIIATILDLFNRNLINLESIKRTGNSFLNKSKYNYYISVNNNFASRYLNEYERTIVNWLFNDKVSDELDEIDIRGKKIEVNERFKEIGKDFGTSSRYRQFCMEYNKETIKKVYQKPSNSLIKEAIILSVILILLLLTNILVISPVYFSLKIPQLALGFIFSVMYASINIALACNARYLNDVYVMGYEQLTGLKKYLNEYSVIKERYPIEIVLWDRYLVFATLLGIADKVQKEFKEELIARGYDEDYIYSNYIGLSLSSNASILSSNIAGSTGTSNGGYSGGGSGGGGRRRWPVAVHFKF